MKAIVIENKFRPMTNSFLPLGGRMMIKTDYSPVNSLRVVFLWAGSIGLSCFLFKTKRTWRLQRALRGSRQGCDGKGGQQRAYASVRIEHSFLWVSPQRTKLWRDHCPMKGHRRSQLRLSTGQRTAPQCWFRDLIDGLEGSWAPHCSCACETFLYIMIQWSVSPLIWTFHPAETVRSTFSLVNYTVCYILSLQHKMESMAT